MSTVTFLNSLKEWQGDMNAASMIESEGRTVVLMVVEPEDESSSGEALLEVRADGSVHTIALDTYLPDDTQSRARGER